MKRILLATLALILTVVTGPAAAGNMTFSTLSPTQNNNGTFESTSWLPYKQTESLARLADAIEGKGTNLIRTTATLSGGAVVTNTLTQARTYSTNIVLASATTPVVLGGGTPFTWLTIVGNSVGRVANTNTIYLQTQADNGTNGVPIAAGGSATLTMSPNRFDYLSNYWIGGVVGGADVFWGY